MLESLKNWAALTLSLASVAGAAHALYREPPAACTPALTLPIAPGDTREIRIPDDDAESEGMDRPRPSVLLEV